MTTDLPAGPELDRLIAERVMGREKVMSDGLHCYIGSLNISNEYNWDEFAPSTNIAHAWDVVERMTKLGEKWWMDRGAGDGEYACTFQLTNERGGIEHCAYGEAPTAPLAICYAALKARS